MCSCFISFIALIIAVWRNNKVLFLSKKTCHLLSALLIVEVRSHSSNLTNVIEKSCKTFNTKPKPMNRIDTKHETKQNKPVHIKFTLNKNFLTTLPCFQKMSYTIFYLMAYYFSMSILLNQSYESDQKFCFVNPLILHRLLKPDLRQSLDKKLS